MALSCNCDFEPEPGDWYWYPPEDFTRMPVLKRRKKCVSCNSILEPKSLVLRFNRCKIPDTDVECKIYGVDGEIPLAAWYLCERCGEIWLNLADIGYKCVNPNDVIKAQKEYWEMTGFDPEKYMDR